MAVDLVGAAFKYGQSLAGAEVLDTSAESKAQVDIARMYLKGVRDVFDDIKAEKEKTDIEQNNQLKAFKETARKAKVHLLEQEQSQPRKVHDAIYDKFKALENEFLLYNTTGKDDKPENEKERANLYAKLQRITQQAVRSRSAIAKYSTMGDDLRITNNIGENIEVSKAIMEVHKNYKHVELIFNEDDELEYHVCASDECKEAMKTGDSSKITVWTIDDFNKNTHFHNIDIDVYGAKRKNGVRDSGLRTPWDFDKKSEQEDFKTTIIPDDKSFVDASRTEFNGRRSWVNSLWDGDNTYDIALEAAKHLFVEDDRNNIAGLVDVDGKGGITFADMDRDGKDGITEADLVDLTDAQKFAWGLNIKAIISALTDPNNEAFNLEASSDALAGDFTDGLEKYFDEGRKLRPSDTGDTDDLTYAQRQTRKTNIADAKKIDDLVQDKNRTTLDLKGAIAKEYDIEQEGNEYVIYKKYKGSKVEDIRFNIKDQNALSSALYEYSGSNELYSKGNYSKYEYQEGDTIENPITVKPGVKGKDFPVEKKNAIEGKYYKNKKTKQVYHFINGDFQEVGSGEEGSEEDDRPIVEIKLEE